MKHYIETSDHKIYSIVSYSFASKDKPTMDIQRAAQDFKCSEYQWHLYPDSETDVFMTEDGKIIRVQIVKYWGGSDGKITDYELG